MAVPSETSQKTYSGNGVATAFSTGFRFLKNSEVVVKQKTGSGSYATKTEGTHYTIAGADSGADGTVTMATAPPVGDTLLIERTVPVTQPTAFSAQGNFSTKVHEDQFDQLVFICQQLARRVATLEGLSGLPASTTAGAGLVVVGTSVDVGAGDGITVNADDVAVSYGNASSMNEVQTAAHFAGNESLAARIDHRHKARTAAPAAGSVLIGNAAAEGAGLGLAREDHVHPVPAPGAPANVTKAAASAGASANFARQDHKHDVDTAAPSSVGTANAEGVAASLARSDHVHNHGAQTDGSHHAVASGAAAGFMSATHFSKVDNFADTALAGTVQTSDAVATNILQRDIGVGVVEMLECDIVGRRSTGAEASAYRLCGTFRRDGASAIQVTGSPATVFTHEDVASWTVGFAIAGSVVSLQVTGAAGATIDWQARVRVVSAP
jgi:hypothetical protein